MKYGKIPQKADLVDKGYPIFSGYKIVGFHRTYLYEDSEVVVVARGVGGTGDVKLSPPNSFITNLSIILQIKSKGVFKKFLFYKLSNEKLRELDSGSAQSQITITDLQSYEIELPPLHIQRKIAAILSAYDDLIENNTRRIKILEEMAQTIYKEWFVKFRFPGYEKVKMVDSELGEIPKGWEVKRLGDVVELAYGKALKKNDRRNGSFPVYGSSGVVGFHDEYLVQGPGIIVGRKGNVGSVFWSQKSFYPIDTVFFVKTNMPLYYVYYNLKEQNFINTDAAVPGLSRNQAYLNEFLLPPNDILHLFEEFIFPIFKQIESLHSQIGILCRTRDLLLPKLIAGEINVAEIDLNVKNIVVES
jgi:type I restriction enzyme S subunit